MISSVVEAPMRRTRNARLSTLRKAGDDESRVRDARRGGCDCESGTAKAVFQPRVSGSGTGRSVCRRRGRQRRASAACLARHRLQPRVVAGRDSRPASSPDGRWIAFSSDRGSGLPFAHGRWEHLHLVDIYVIRPDGSGLKRVTEHGNFCGSPKWSSDSLRIVAYCMSAEETLTYRQPRLDGGDTRIVSIDIAKGTTADVAAGPGVKLAPAFQTTNEIGFIRKDVAGAGIHYSSGKAGPKGDLRSAAWSPDGTRVAFHKRLAAGPGVGHRMWSRRPDFELRLGGVPPSFHPSGGR